MTTPSNVVAARVTEKMNFLWPSDGCFVWTGLRHKHGYGVHTVDGRKYLVHRLVYELALGPIPEGMDLDHLCSNRLCANPTHLEPVTRSENTRRGLAKRWSVKPPPQLVCKNGHKKHMCPDGTMACRECGRQSTRRHRMKQGT